MSALLRRLERLERAHTASRCTNGPVLLWDDGRGRLSLFDLSNAPGDPLPLPPGYRPQRADESAEDYMGALRSAGLFPLVGWTEAAP